MKQQLIQKKVIKKNVEVKPKRLNVEITFLSVDELLRTKKEIKEQLRIIFKYHIGKEQAISRFEIFEEILKTNPYRMDIYRRHYWWKLIERCIKEMKEECFVTRKGSSYFVLKNEEELAYYLKMTKRMIGNIRESQTKASSWVKNKKWKYI